MKICMKMFMKLQEIFKIKNMPPILFKLLIDKNNKIKKLIIIIKEIVKLTKIIHFKIIKLIKILLLTIVLQLKSINFYKIKYYL